MVILFLAVICVVLDLVLPPSSVHCNRAIFEFLLGPIGAGISALASLGGSVGTSVINANAQAETNEKNFQIAREQMAFQDRMRSTSYQTAVKDMRAAGLNPALAYQQGGAATPSGASANMIAPQIEDFVNKGLSSALELRRLKKEVKAVDSQAMLNNASAVAKQADTKLSETNALVAKKNAEALDAKLPAIREQAKADLKAAKFNNKAAEYDAIMRRVKEGAGVLNDAVGLVKPKVSIKLPPRRQAPERKRRPGMKGVLLP